MNALRGSVAGLALLVLGGWLCAAPQPLSTKEKTEQADVIATGTIKAIYRFEQRFLSRTVDKTTIHYVLEVSVASADKGDGVKPGDMVYARGWRLKEPLGHKGGSGHYLSSAEFPQIVNLPPGTTVRVFLKRAQDGGFDIVYPNGIELVEQVQGR